MRTMRVLALSVRWFAFLVVSVEWQVHSQAVQQTSEVDSSYNFYYEQPCCTGPIIKNKYHVRHKRGESFTFIKTP